MDAGASVVLVNGLWLGNAALLPLARRLERAGFRVYPFSYPSVRCDLRANAERLQAFLGRVPGGTVHFVAYSLGGLVLRTLFQFHPRQRPGRIVLLASPQQGIQSAAVVARSRLGRVLLGQSVLDLLAGRTAGWDWPAREIGVLAGRRSFGIGRLFARFSEPNDGTVRVAETRVPTARDQRVVNVAHSGMLLSAEVAAEVVAFLETGAFRTR